MTATAHAQPAPNAPRQRARQTPRCAVWGGPDPRRAAEMATKMAPAQVMRSITERLTNKAWREGVRGYYERDAADYCQSTVDLDMAGQRAAFTAWLPSGGRVLDLGCGSGRDLRAFKDAGFEAAGLDISSRMADWARDYAQAPVLVADLLDIPTPDAAFDGVWASASLLHLRRRDLPRALREIRRVLSPRGVAFVSLKRGEGEAIDAQSRYFTLVSDPDIDRMLADAGLHVVTSTADAGGFWASRLALRSDPVA